MENFVFKEYLETERLLLRAWLESDAAALYKYASDAAVANPAGWPVHESELMSLAVIQTVFSAPGTYAVVLKESGEAVGCCGIVPPEARPNVKTCLGEVEIGYWIGRAHWGRGLIPEAVDALVEHCFGDLRARRAWISCFAFNAKSRRVAEKCGFAFDHSERQGDIEELFFVKENENYGY
ncbi:MAG: GNAT family N-acetyltransferase [[Clostridium] fimetarium]|nr:GNAT family N-acetyltransferase [Alistipes timonensis]MCM1404792.1 GNAT family N-acetyltransferase [[Clostridium] fimetarium]